MTRLYRAKCSYLIVHPNNSSASMRAALTIVSGPSLDGTDHLVYVTATNVKPITLHPPVWNTLHLSNPPRRSRCAGGLTLKLSRRRPREYGMNRDFTGGRPQRNVRTHNLHSVTALAMK